MRFIFSNKKLLGVATLVVSAGCIVFFQNCSAPKGFIVDSSNNNTVCDSNGNCKTTDASESVSESQLSTAQEAAAQQAAAQQAAAQQAAAQQAAAQQAAAQQAAAQQAAAQQAAAQQAAAQQAAAAAASMVNFGAFTETVCNNAVADHIRTKLPVGAMVVWAQSCRVGAGCGLSCGKPNGTTCLSANPNAQGACLSPSDIQTAVSINMDAYNARRGFNFVAYDSATCNNSIAERFRIATGRNLASTNQCGLGKGCGLSCGTPNGTSCVSANPSAQGACFGYEELRNLN